MASSRPPERRTLVPTVKLDEKDNTVRKREIRKKDLQDTKKSHSKLRKKETKPKQK